MYDMICLSVLDRFETFPYGITMENYGITTENYGITTENQ